MKFYEKVALLRKKQGLSQEELAEKLGISRQSVYKWEQGVSMPELDKIVKLANIFSVSCDLLLNDNKDIADEMQPYVPVYRKVFDSQNKLNTYYSSLEHGYADTSMCKRSDSDAIWKKNEEKLAELLKKRNYSYVLRVQHDSGIMFFVDDKRNICGFIFHGCEQFVCPIENLINVTAESDPPLIAQSETRILGAGGGAFFAGTAPGNVNVGPQGYKIHIEYYDHNGVSHVYTIGFNIHSSLYVELYCKDRDAYLSMQSALSSELKNSVNKIRDKIMSLRYNYQNTANASSEKQELDIAVYETAAKQSQEEHVKSERIIYAEAHKRNIRHALIWGPIFIACIAVIVTVFVLNCIYN